MNISYRSDIDGLRAVAVVAVVAFHAFPEWIAGGFIGVDIFFVISGYLITTIILKGLASSQFNFTNFYTRRILRIFPALITVLSICLIFGWFSLLKDEYRQLGKHTAAGAGFISNFILLTEVGYFDNDADTKPLLHLWSLGIEEQFYLFWPIFLWLSFKYSRRPWKFCITLLFISLLSNLFLIHLHPAVTFYSPLTRVWELLIGSLLAFYKPHQHSSSNLIKTIRGNFLNELVSILGIFLILFGIYHLDKSFHFPGLWALIPTIGAALIICSPSSWINRRIFSFKPLVWMGLISFPLYLWHWPLLVFARIINGETPRLRERIIIIFIAITLSWLTYHFLERPIRSKLHLKILMIALIICMALIGICGYVIYKNNGVEIRKAAFLEGFIGDIDHLEYHRYIAQNYFICKPEIIAKESLTWEGFTRCMQSKESSNIDIAIVGDSHAEHLFLGIAEALPRKNIVFYIKTSPPFLRNPEFKNIFHEIEKSKTIKKVILSMYWSERINEVPSDSSLDRELTETIEALVAAGKEVYLVDDVPKFPFTPLQCKGKRWLNNKTPTCTISPEQFKLQSDSYTATLQKVTKIKNVRLISISKYICNEWACSMTAGNKILYRDKNHLNLVGSSYIGQKIIHDHQNEFQ